MIPHEYIEELTRRTDIVDVVGNYVQLKRKGRLYGGLCPFHSEKTPSFYVYPDTQSFYCFGCGVGGDVIHFVRRINSIDYTEAVKMLAARAGMPEPQEDDKTGRLRSRILSMNKEAARYFHACLNSTVEEARQARAYWRRRGLDDKTIVRFGLGYAPDDGQGLYQYLRDKGYNQQELDASGLFKRSQSGRIYCLFWKRVMTPIFDLRGNIIAFGGRVLDDSKPKYVNSPETLVYHKSDTVFALQIAKKSASRRFVLCEGYMDVISMHQAGIDTAVCACGTALTPEQVRLERAASRLTALLVLLAIGVGAVWLFWRQPGDLARALTCTCAVLAATCPGAAGQAAGVAAPAEIGRAAERGELLTRGAEASAARTARTVRRSIWLLLAYHAVCLPLAACGVIGPAAAAALACGASGGVLLCALRGNGTKGEQP